ncbi:DUF4747 family protein [Bacteroides graminisolvens]|uniref:DUF4747 family protein n=1 Tax=Bacteroides graminisolvens TaxID=477666 RepID=UPI0023F50AB5|nr:DUF4747 family protein [Bacteroides graminisolvens]MDD3209619.1 DUF4747 family protein [Bacteroides graminisolvens]
MGNNETKKIKFQIVNIKLQTSKTGKDKLKAYENLIKELKNKRIHSSVAENIHVIIYSCYERKTPISNVKYLYGVIGKGIYFENDVVRKINIEKSEGENAYSDKNSIWEPKLGEYIFIPDIHRFVYINTSGISINDVYRFLKESLSVVADRDDIVEVEIVKDPKITDEILSAYQVHMLNYSVSYTNDDPVASHDKLLDERLKNIFAGKFSAKIEADHHGYLNTEDELTGGGVRLSEQNGQINEAIITQEKGGQKVRLSNAEKPRFFTVEASEENFRERIISKITRNTRE